MVETPPSAVPRVVYSDGQIVPAAGATVPLEDAGVQYGLGFFETFRTGGGSPHHWSFHRARLTQACATAGISIPPSFLAVDDSKLRETVTTLLRENEMPEAVFRYTVTAGSMARSAEPEPFRFPAEFLTLRPLPPDAPAEGIALRVLKLTRDNGEWLPRPKSLNYANAFAGARELSLRSVVASDEGLFLARESGFVVETPRQAIAWFEGERFCYPDPEVGAVTSTCLQWVLGLGLQAAPRRVVLREFLEADAVFVLNAVRGITPVREIWDDSDGERLRTFQSDVHPRVQFLMHAWKEALRATANQ